MAFLKMIPIPLKLQANPERRSKIAAAKTEIISHAKSGDCRYPEEIVKILNQIALEAFQEGFSAGAKSAGSQTKSIDSQADWFSIPERTRSGLMIMAHATQENVDILDDTKNLDEKEPKAFIRQFGKEFFVFKPSGKRDDHPMKGVFFKGLLKHGFIEMTMKQNLACYVLSHLGYKTYNEAMRKLHARD